MKMWEGRFSKEVDAGVNDFNSSISFDCRLYQYDIRGSIAHATMLGESGIIEKSEAEAIIRGLEEILRQLDAGEMQFDPNAEDIHMFVEQQLTAAIGDAGKRLHTARSRNDQVALDMRMYVLAEIDEVCALTAELLRVLADMAAAYTDAVMPGYTHLQRAQPVTFAHILMAYAQMFVRDITRLRDCKQRADEMPLGGGALAGTTYPINRDLVAELLGFAAITQNSMDSVADRDYAMEFLSALSILMSHLSRLSEDVILWCTREFGFLELDDAFATGSSIMPQKKNPDVAELVRGKTGRVYGDLMTLLTVMKGLPLAYNKDMQEDKPAVFDAVDTVKLCLKTFAPMLKTATVNRDTLRRAAGEGFINATDCADYLVTKGVPFRDAYKATGKLVALCIQKKQTLETLDMEDYRAAHPVFDEGVYNAIALERCVNERTSPGGPAQTEVRKQIAYINAFLEAETV